ncbi:sodium-independent sulfate anion transporter-like [Paramacrobiotus metropolitanus]|uniref:sodium-independent sulfate anion transporter-like n=1 Tax=Paramacrobiotus metropolitanus TaxID=2943436 RepID=UPI0024460A97|nr:sodium-independent sulfate anion transporter-like [Paramacrobiotus metropolitanus]XP_055339709.1 sodium-independent sulfate anion transporter-like [Paramacrobiotus metropolitanus]
MADPEKWVGEADALNMDTDETLEQELTEDPADIQPKFFRTPSVDLIPTAAAVAAARRRSSVRSIKRSAASAEARRRSFATSPHKSAVPPFDAAAGEVSIELEDSRPYPPRLETDDEEIARFGGPYTWRDLKEEMKGLCTLKTLQRKLPITAWLPKYSREDLMGDVVAGLTVGLTVVPQCLAYAQIADLNLKYGLNSAYMGCFVYALLGTSKDVTVGPTAILSLLTGAFVVRDAGREGEWAVLLCFCVGCFQLLMGFLRLGFLINFISTPVVSGFTQAAVVVIILSQIKNLMGLPSFGSAKDNIIQTLAGYYSKIDRTNGWDVLIGSICITLLLLMREMKMPAWRASEGAAAGTPPRWWRALKETIRLMSVSRYAIVVVLATALQFVFHHNNIKGLSVVGDVNAELSPPVPPSFNVEGRSFGNVLATFGSGLVLVPLLATMESIAVAKTFAHKFRYNIDTTQEFLALGAGNLISSFFGSYPVTGAFTRSALNAESGVRTPLGCIVTGGFVVVAIVALKSLFQYIPKAALAAVIICACLTMFDFQIFRELWFIRKSELFVLILTMAMCLFLRVEYGLLIGLTVSILMLVYPMARPVVIVRRRRKSLLNRSPNMRLDECRINVIPQGAIFFPAAEYVKEVFNDPLFSVPVKALTTPRESNANGELRGGMALRDALPPIIFDGIHLTSSDYSTLRALRSVFVNCKANHRDIVFVNTSDEILDIIMPFRKKTLPAVAASAGPDDAEEQQHPVPSKHPN